MGINTIFWQYGLAQTAATNAALISNASPIFALILAVGIGQEKLVPQARALGMLVALAGAALVVGTDGLDFGAGSAAGNLLSRRRNRLLGRLQRLWRSAAALDFALAGHDLGDDSRRADTPRLSPVGVRNWDVSHVSPLAWSGLAYSILFGTVVAATLWSGAVKSVGASGAMIYAYLSPILSVGFAALLLGEHLQAMQVVGALFSSPGVSSAREEG